MVWICNFHSQRAYELSWGRYEKKLHWHWGPGLPSKADLTVFPNLLLATNLSRGTGAPPPATVHLIFGWNRTKWPKYRFPNGNTIHDKGTVIEIWRERGPHSIKLIIFPYWRSSPSLWRELTSSSEVRILPEEVVSRACLFFMDPHRSHSPVQVEAVAEVGIHMLEAVLLGVVVHLGLATPATAMPARAAKSAIFGSIF